MTVAGDVVSRRAVLASIVLGPLACAGCGDGEPAPNPEIARKRTERLEDIQKQGEAAAKKKKGR
jgi:hypothetical protein